ncbi:MAG: 1-acyl-sn-glycerol-3-phosphate acyltransferase [Anaerolineae bacterium]|nr:MAG: 1-acyl-sn-glycerol-3-phosphate acyltransferase [Anaerolineae bacterium]
MPRLRPLLHRILRFLFRTLTRLQVEGLENIPAQGGCLLISNHISILDAPLIFSLLDREDATGLVAYKHRRNPFYRFLVDNVGGIWIRRGEADVHALRAAWQHLKNGGLLGIAPEGTRSRQRTLLRGKPGAAYLAQRAGVPVIPMAIWGTETAFATLAKLRRPEIHVIVGKPFHLHPLPRGDRDAALQQQVDAMMERIAAMLPPAYRGVYA